MTEETKIVTYKGLRYKVPAWTRYLAKNLNNEVNAYEFMPLAISLDKWVNQKGKYKKVKPLSYTDWPNSVERIV